MPRQYKPKPHRPKPAHATWVVAADAGRARIFQAGNEEAELTELTDLLNADARLQDHDALSDRRGEVTQGAAGIGHAFEPRHTHHEHVAVAFAQTVAQRLNAAVAAGEVARLYLIAEPSFLGLLRQRLDKPALAAVVQEQASDLTRRPPGDIRKALPARF